MKHKNLKFMSLLLAVLFVAFAFVGGTYAWQSEQQVTNNIKGEKTKLMSVELIKLEKNSDGTKTENPIPNTAFYLYKSSGKQVGSRYMTDENGKISVSLPVGQYYFEEASPSVGYTYDKDNEGNNIKKYSFTVNEQEEKITVKAYNIKLKGNLVIQNTVENTDGTPLTDEQKKQGFVYTVTFSDNNSYNYRIDNGEEKTLQSGGTIILCDGQSAVFQQLPVGVLYNVTQTIVPGYVCVNSGHRGNITSEQSVVQSFNYYEIEKMGKIVVTKDAVGENDKNKEFSFVAKIGDTTEKFTLKNGEFKSFTGIPLGTKYEVSEENADGYTSTVKEYSGQIVNADRVNLPFKNVSDTFSDSEYGSLIVKKQVSGDNADNNKEFNFKIVYQGEKAPQEEIFSLKSGEAKAFENIPRGVNYTVTEIDANDYLPVLNSASGSIAGAYTSSVTFTNIVPEDTGTTKLTKITVTKQLSGELIDSDKTKEFAMTLIVDNQQYDFTIKSGETKEFEVPVNSFYRLVEQDCFDDGFSQSFVNGSGVTTEKQIDITVTNTYVGETRTEINGTKKWSMGGHTDVALPKSITVQLKKGDLTVEEKEVVPNDNGVWDYTFVAPKYNEDGSLAEYSVNELPIKNYNTSYDGYNITNTYVAPIKVDLPVINKSVKGKNAPNSTFEFVLKGNSNSPMPSGSEGSRKIISLEGSGKVETGSVTFTESGKYVYNLYEINSKQGGWEYDTTTYTIVFTVTESNDVLSCKQEILKGNSVTDKVQFVNIYDDSYLSNNVNISGTVIWNHGDNPESKQPTSIMVYVYGDGEKVAQRLVTSKDNWKYSFELPKYNGNGDKIEYTVDEAKVNNYSKKINGYNIINTYTGSSAVKPNDTSNNGNSTKSPLTGDYSVWIILMLVVCVLGLVVSVVLYRKQLMHKESRHK